MYKIDLFRSVLYQKIPTHENIKMPVETRFIAVLSQILINKCLYV